MPKIYLSYPTDGGCTFHRILQPARFCNDHFAKHGWEMLVGPDLPQGHEIVMLHGLPTEFAIPHISGLKRKGAKFVWGVDDDWSSIPEWNPANPGDKGLAIYEVMKQLADWIVVSTPALRNSFFDVSHKVLIAPNLLDLKTFPEIPFELKVDPEGREYKDYALRPKVPVRIAWVGGETHKKDLDDMNDALDQFLDKYGGERAVVIYQGMMPHPRLIRKYLHRSLFHQPMTTFASYQKVLNSIEPHIYLAPLAKIPFNESKSNLRIIEGWALGAAPIATDWGEYKCIRNGVDGRLVSTTDQWYSALVRLTTDHEQRLSMALHGRMRVEQQYDWNREQCRKQWIETFSKILGVENE